MTDKTDNIVFKKQPKTHKYLYGVSILHFTNMSYIDAINEKIKLLKQKLLDLQNFDFVDTDDYESWQIKETIEKDLLKALEFNTALKEEYLTELKRRNNV